MPDCPFAGGGEFGDLPSRAILGGEGQVDVGAVKTMQEISRCLPIEELFDDLVAGFGIGGCREGRQRHTKSAAQLADPQIIGAEIMPPLRDAMRLVHGNQADTDAPQHPHCRPGGEAFGRDVKELQATGFERLPDLFGLFLGIARGQRTGLDAYRPERAHLIPHQRNQRRDHHGHALAQKRRKLKAQGFTATGGHDRQHVFAARDRVHDILLPGAEGIEPENIAQKRGSAWHENPVRLFLSALTEDHFTLRFGEQVPAWSGKAENHRQDVGS